jgi:hypothetical protein
VSLVVRQFVAKGVPLVAQAELGRVKDGAGLERILIFRLIGWGQSFDFPAHFLLIIIFKISGCWSDESSRSLIAFQEVV